MSDSASPTAEDDPPHVIDGDVNQDQSVQCLDEPPVNHIRVGVLKYNWGTEVQTQDRQAASSEQRSKNYRVRCEYCGERPVPTLDQVCRPDAETPLTFCCARWQQLCQKLKMEIFSSSIQPPVNHQIYIDPRKSFSYEDSSFHQGQSYAVDPQTSALRLDLPKKPPHTLSFKLSSLPVEEWRTLYPREAEQKMSEEQLELPVFDHKPDRFGLCYHRTAAGVQRYYSDGSTFLTGFPDASAHLLYPSGLLAVIVVSSKQNGRVCIVYDDVSDPHQPMRAIFHSHGHAVCNHNNGKIWLMLNGSGGQLFTDMGVRVRRWDWGARHSVPTPLHPVFLSLNRMVAVRVLEHRRVFISFLAKGKQAKFNVGSCCAQCESKVAASPPVKQEEEEEELPTIISQIHAAAKKLVDCGRSIQNTLLKDS